ncbi:MAG: hypothetical protein ACI90U_002535 [Pseudomonadales bacterium]|jgi:hypothetical protein
MLNINPALIILAASFGLAATVNSYAGSSAAFDACKQEISKKYSDATSIRFKNNPATSNRGGKYTFLINASAKTDDVRNVLKVKCVSSKQNEIISLTIEDGRW